MTALLCVALATVGQLGEPVKAPPWSVQLIRPAAGHSVRSYAPLVVGGRLIGDQLGLRASDLVVEVLDADGVAIAGTVVFSKQTSTFGHVFAAPPKEGWPTPRLTVLVTSLDNGQQAKAVVHVLKFGEKPGKAALIPAATGAAAISNR